MKINWNETLGYLAIVLASCFFGASASVGKAIMQNGISTVMLMQIRSIFTAAVLFMVLLIAGRAHLRIARSDILYFLALGIPGLALVNASYYYAVQLLPIAVAVFVQFLAPVVVFIIGWATGNEQANAAKLSALGLSIIGTYFMVQLQKAHISTLPVIGVISAFVSMLTYAFYLLLSHHLGKKYSPWTLIFYGYLFAGLFWCLVQNVSTTANQLTIRHQWGQALLFSVVSTLVPFVLFMTGLRRVTPTGAAIASTTETVTASLFAFLVLGETLAFGQIIGAGLILGAVLLLVIPSRTVEPQKI